MQAIIDRASRRFDVQLAERTRIAQKLHDTLLQGFFSASVRLRVVIDQIPDHSAARPQLDRILPLYVEHGKGPTVVLLHGFPERWYGWRHQIPKLAQRFRVAAQRVTTEVGAFQFSR